MYKSGQNNSPTFNIWGYLVFENGQWFIEPYLEGHTLVMGNADSYKLPDELVKSMDLNSLLETEPCPDCDGEGGNNANCKRCNGTGVIELANTFFK